MHVISKESYSIKQFDCELVQKFKMITQRSTSKLYEILTWRTSLQSCNIRLTIAEELSHSQDSLTSLRLVCSPEPSVVLCVHYQ